MTPSRRHRFVAEYVRDFNATQAAIRAGFSRRSANHYGPYLLRCPAIAAAVEAAMVAERSRIRIDGDRVILELMRIAFSDIRTYLTAGADGAPALRPHDSLTEHETAAIAALSPATKTRGPSIRLHGKKHALRALARHLGLDERRPSVDPRAIIAEAARLRAMLCEAAGIEEPNALPAPVGESR
jgi:phage terminase small subunit